MARRDVGRHSAPPRGVGTPSRLRVSQVAWSADGGVSRQDAELVSTPARYAWTQFACPWDAVPGEHVLMTRATDASGATQPMTIPSNLGGYVFNAVHPHPITVDQRVSAQRFSGVDIYFYCFRITTR